MKNRVTKRFAVMAVLCVLIMALAAPALAASYSKVYGQTQTRIRVRASASSGATVIDNLIKGACVYVTNSSTSGDATYIKVNYRNSDGKVDTGWVCQKDGSETYVKILSADQASKTFSVKSGNLPSKKVGTFTAAERETAEDTSSAGTSANEIEEAQKMLKALGYYTGEITGNVGNKTKEAIKQFQRAYGLTADGVAGPKTLAKLKDVYIDNGNTSGGTSTGALKLGSSGSAVRDLQIDLTTLGYYWADITGNFGAKTQAAVKSFQQKNNLTADGVAGTKTINAIADAIARKGGTSSSYASGTTLKEGSKGTAVSSLQTDLKQLGYYYADITGNFGEKTAAAVKAFQKDKGLTADGVAGSKTLSAVASAIKAAGGSTSDSSTGMKLGSTGDKVRALQIDLTALGYYYGDITGHYGSMTQTAVKKFQKAKGLNQDGVAGTSTVNAITKALASTGSSSASSSASAASGSLREGDKSDAVREMQEMLKELGYYYGDITGSFGSLTKKAVRAFQDDNDLTVDGIAGQKTLNKLYSLTGKTNTGTTTSSGSTVKEEDSYGRVIKDNVNLRTSYSTSSAAKASLKEGKLLRITRVHNVAGVKWYYVTVQTGGVTHKGYLRGDMVTIISKSEYTSGGGSDLDLGEGEIIGMIRVTVSKANLRDEDDDDGKIVGTASKGEAFYYIDKSGSWYQTKSGYWIHKSCVEVMTDAEVDDYVGSDTYDGGTYREGDTGTMVKWIQEALIELGYYGGKYGGEVTGHYGNKTKDAVRRFQRDHDLNADGVCGPKTVAKLIEEIAKDYAGGSTSVKYNSTIYNYNWFTYKNTIVAKGSNTPTITDILTGRSLKIYIQSTGNHADVEPLTATDTEVLCSLYGVANANQLVTQNKYQRRAVVFTNAAGKQFVGSIYAIPHGLNTVSGNNFDGQFCLHFLSSKTHGTDRVDTDDNGHQEKIEAGVAALKAQVDADGKKLYNVVTKK